MIIVGIDPGLTGAFAFYNTESKAIFHTFSMPTDTLAKGKGTRREISWPVAYHWITLSLAKTISTVERAFIERVSSSPQMGVTSAFNFGRTYGGLESLIAALHWPAEFVTPAKWKKSLAVPADKDDARHRASQLMPRCVEHWTPQRGVMTKEQAGGRAEASLLCIYGEHWLAERGLLHREKPQRKRFVG